MSSTTKDALRTRRTEEEEERLSRKKAKREAKRIAKELRCKQHVTGYTDEDNPFGDEKLSERFVWGKKIEKKLMDGARPEDMSLEAERERHERRMLEVEKVKKEREERERMRAQMDEENTRLARERAWAEAVELEKKEEQFLLEQSRIRSQIRLVAGRAKAVDIFSRMLHYPEMEDEKLPPPDQIIDSLNTEEKMELSENVMEHKELDRDSETNVQFWESIAVLCDFSLRQDWERDEGNRGHASRRLNKDVDRDVLRMFSGKDMLALETLENDIMEMVKSGRASEHDYWEEVLSRLKVQKAKARLKEILRQVQSLPRKEEKPRPFEKFVHVAPARGPEDERDASRTHDERRQDDAHRSLDPSIMRLASASRSSTKPVNQEEEFRRSALGAMGVAADVEELGQGFNEEVMLANQKYSWQDKYRPRKPKYFNRVHTGYDWNKYNRTHYDHDNPPPKTIQGYKFNIFYPDLIDREKTPTYKLEPDRSNTDGDTCILRFHAGPPYEDIAFRIANKDWEYSRKRGFKCVFDRGVLQLYFNLKRARYRR